MHKNPWLNNSPVDDKKTKVNQEKLFGINENTELKTDYMIMLGGKPMRIIVKCDDNDNSEGPIDESSRKSSELFASETSSDTVVGVAKPNVSVPETDNEKENKGVDGMNDKTGDSSVEKKTGSLVELKDVTVDYVSVSDMEEESESNTQGNENKHENIESKSNNGKCEDDSDSNADDGKGENLEDTKGESDSNAEDEKCEDKKSVGGDKKKKMGKQAEQKEKPGKKEETESDRESGKQVRC